MFALLTSVIVVVAIYGYVGVQREIGRYEAEVGESHAVTGHVLRAALLEVLESDGEPRALDLLKTADQGIRKVDIRWVRFDAPTDASRQPRVQLDALAVDALRRGEDYRRLDKDPDGTRRVTTYVALERTGGDRGALEFTEPLVKEAAYVRAAVWNEVAGAAFAAITGVLIATVLGVVLIARPMGAIIRQAQRIGTGDLTARLGLRTRDEMADLAREMDAMCDRLADAQSKIGAESMARITALEQLRHAERLTTVGKLASGMAHELGTPLNVVAMRAKMIASSDLSRSEVTAAAQVISEQTARMTMIMRQLLDFARRGTAKKASVDLELLVTTTLALLEPMARKSNVEITVRRGSEPHRIQGDVSQLQQVLTNLVINGIHASEGGGDLIVEIGREEATPPGNKAGGAGRYCSVSVRDDGVGIRNEDLARIFEPFFTTKQVGQGTGLGLSVAYGIVEDHGGWIDVDSEPGKGSRFTVFLRSEDA
jgi:signal transduction histidine kinase